MFIKKDPQELCERLTEVEFLIEDIIQGYLKDYADYGWDSFTEALACIAGTIRKEKIELFNAQVRGNELKPEMFESIPSDKPIGIEKIR